MVVVMVGCTINSMIIIVDMILPVRILASS